MLDMKFANVYSKNPILTPKPQFIDLRTRVTDVCTSLLDLVFVSFIDKITCHGTKPKMMTMNVLLHL